MINKRGVEDAGEESFFCIDVVEEFSFFVVLRVDVDIIVVIFVIYVSFIYVVVNLLINSKY